MMTVENVIATQSKRPKYQKIFAISGWFTIETNCAPSTFVPATIVKKTKLNFGL